MDITIDQTYRLDRYWMARLQALAKKRKTTPAKALTWALGRLPDKGRSPGKAVAVRLPLTTAAKIAHLSRSHGVPKAQVVKWALEKV